MHLFETSSAEWSCCHLIHFDVGFWEFTNWYRPGADDGDAICSFRIKLQGIISSNMEAFVFRHLNIHYTSWFRHSNANIYSVPILTYINCLESLVESLIYWIYVWLISTEIRIKFFVKLLIVKICLLHLRMNCQLGLRCHEKCDTSVTLFGKIEMCPEDFFARRFCTRIRLMMRSFFQ